MKYLEDLLETLFRKNNLNNFHITVAVSDIASEMYWFDLYIFCSFAQQF